MFSTVALVVKANGRKDWAVLPLCPLILWDMRPQFFPQQLKNTSETEQKSATTPQFLDSTRAEALNVFAGVFADGGLCGGLGSSWPGRLPVRSRLIWKCCDRGRSLHAQRHGHRNCKYVFLSPGHQSSRAHSHKRFLLQTYSSCQIYFMRLVVSLCLHGAPSAACAKSGAIYLAILTPGGRMPPLQLYPLCPRGILKGILL